MRSISNEQFVNEVAQRLVGRFQAAVRLARFLRDRCAARPHRASGVLVQTLGPGGLLPAERAVLGADELDEGPRDLCDRRLRAVRDRCRAVAAGRERGPGALARSVLAMRQKLEAEGRPGAI